MLGGKQILAFFTSYSKSFHLSRPHHGDAHASGEYSVCQKLTIFCVWGEEKYQAMK